MKLLNRAEISAMFASARHATRTVADFLRLRLLGISLGAALIGVVSVNPALSGRMVAVLGVAFFFHVASYVFNDVADIDVDRANPHRAQSPLVARAVPLSTAVLVAVCALIAAFALDRVVFGPFGWRIIALAAAFVGLVGYDFAGKRIMLSPATDALQGIGWGALACYGALCVGSPSAVTFLSAGYIVIAITFINGVHGALRDIASDLGSGARTTAILLGARPGASGPVTSALLIWYAWAFQSALAAIVIVVVGAGLPNGAAGWAAAGMAVISILVSGVFLKLMLSPGDLRYRRFMGGLHIITVFGAGASVAVVGSGPLPALCVLGVMVLPLLPGSWPRAADAVRAGTRTAES